VQLDQIHRAHRQPGPVDQATDVAVQLHIAQPGVARADFGRLFLGQIPEFGQILVPEQGVVVESDLGVQGHHVAAAGDDQRIDLGQTAIVADKGPAHRFHESRGMTGRGTVDVQPLAELADLKVLQSGQRIEMLLEESTRGSRPRPFSISTPPSLETISTGMAAARSITMPRYSSRAMSQPSSTSTCRTSGPRDRFGS
jgi:hypothetical protein